MSVPIKGTAIDSYLAEAKEPMVQNLTLCIPSASLATEIIKLETAVQSALITVPARISLVDDDLPLAEANLRTINEATIAPRNAQNATPETAKNGIAPIPNIIENVAPREAPEEIPSMYGSAKGFCTQACITHPERARPAPTTAPKSTLGNRIDQMTLKFEFPVKISAFSLPIPSILYAKISYVVLISTLKAPIEATQITEIMSSRIIVTTIQ